MEGSIVTEVNEYLEKQLKRELTGDELLIMVMTLKYMVDNDIKIIPK